MSKDKLTDYDSTASNNTDVGGISIAEGMLPSAVNNAIREQMSHQKEAFGAGTPLYVDQTNNKVGIGTTSPSTFLDVEGNGVPFEINSTVSNVYKMQFKNAGTLTSYLGTNPNAFYFADASATQLARIDSDGIKFGTDSAAANALDDYEEGTWTPVSGGGNGSTAYYTKIGRLVQLHGDVTFSGNSGSVSLITGLPYAPVTQGGGVAAFQSITTSTALSLLIYSGGIVAYNTAQSTVNISTNGRIIFSLTYYTS